MEAVAKNPNDAAALAVLDQDANLHAMLRTTCVATMLSAGHATNALPQRARANINCRIFPGVSREAVLAQLAKVAADPHLSVTIPEVRGPVAQPPPLTSQIMGPVEKISGELWPGVPVVPGLEPGASIPEASCDTYSSVPRTTPSKIDELLPWNVAIGMPGIHMG